MIWLVIWVVLMILWLFGVGWLSYDPANPRAVGGVLIPWLCVLILGLVVFGAVEARPAAVAVPAAVR